MFGSHVAQRAAELVRLVALMARSERDVEVGEKRSAAEALAADIARLPQTCMRHDRLSLLEQDGMTEADALVGEWAHGQVSLAADAAHGAARFTAGAGRGGSFADID